MMQYRNEAKHGEKRNRESRLDIPLSALLILLCLALLLLSLAGCREEKSGLRHRGEAAQEDQNVLVRIGDDVITKHDVEAVLAKIPERKRKMFRKRALDDLIEARVFANEARQVGLDKDPKAQKAIEKVTGEILARHFVKKHLDKEAEPQEETIKRFYDDHQDQFVVPDGVLIQHIVVKKEVKANEILDALKEGASFDELAKKESIVGSARDGGRQKWLFKGRMDPALQQVAFALEEEVLSDVIRTKQGFQVIKVLERRDEHLISFEKAKERIRHRLFWKNKRELVDQYYEAAKVNTHPAEPGVLVKIGDELITEETLGPILAKAPEREKEKLKLRWIDYFIETRVFSKEAKKIHLENDPEVARDLRIRTDGTLAEVFSHRFIRDKVQITDRDIEAYYASRQEQFRTPLKVRAKSILVKTREEAKEVLEEVKEGTSFGYLAQKKSLHPYALKRAGEIGWFRKGEKDPAVEKVAFSLKEGQVSGVIKTEAGYEIIKLMAKKGGEIKPFDEVKQGIKINLMMQKFEEEKQRYYKEAGVKILGV